LSPGLLSNCTVATRRLHPLSDLLELFIFYSRPKRENRFRVDPRSNQNMGGTVFAVESKGLSL
jgi:hypothetical protein